MKNIYLKELKDNKKSFIFWSIGIIFLLVAGMSKYLGYSKSGVSITELFNGLPSGFSSFFGVNSIDLESASGFFAVMVIYLSVMLGIHAILLGSNIIAKEETDKTAEFLYVKPISRLTGLKAKLTAGLTIILGINIVTTIASILIVAAFNNGPSATGDVLLLMPAVLFLQLIFFAVGFAVAAGLRRPKQAVRLSGALLMVTFLLSVFVDITTKYNWLKYLTPFKYFDAKQIFADRSYSFGYIVLTLLLVTVLLATSRMIYQKRDFNI